MLRGLEHLQQGSVCDPTGLFLTSKYRYLLFSNPTHKTKSGTANRWETTNSNAPGPIKLSGKSQQMLGFAVPFKMLGQNHVLQSQTGIFWLLFVQFSFAEPHTEHQWWCSYGLACSEQLGVCWYRRLEQLKLGAQPKLIKKLCNLREYNLIALSQQPSCSLTQ